MEGQNKGNAVNNEGNKKEATKLEETIENTRKARMEKGKETEDSDDFWAPRDEEYICLLSNTLFSERLGLHGEFDQDAVNMRMRGTFWMEYGI